MFFYAVTGRQEPSDMCSKDKKGALFRRDPF